MLKVIEDTTGSKTPFIQPDLISSTSEENDRLLSQWPEVLNHWAVGQTLIHLGKSTGDHIQLRKEYNYFPVLIGNDNRPVFLFRFIQLLDEQIDYDRLKEEFPNLSYSQINGVISFLCKMGQVNIFGTDIGELEDEIESEDSELMDELRKALGDQEITRVLHNDQRDR